MSKKDEGAKKAGERAAFRAALAALAGKEVGKLNAAELTVYLVMLGQAAGFVDAAGIIHGPARPGGRPEPVK